MSSLGFSVDSPRLRRAMRRMAGTVCIVAAGRAGNRVGLTATSLTSLCMDPPALLVCINRTSSTFAAISAERQFSVNLLAADQVECARTFSSAEVTGETRFAGGMWIDSSHGIPHLENANASVLCEVEMIVPYGSHAAFIGRAIEVHIGSAATDPLLYFDGDYRRLLPEGR